MPLIYKTAMATLLGACFSLAQAAPITLPIDNFSVDQAQRVTGTGPCDSFSPPPCGVISSGIQSNMDASILGGYRDLYINETGGAAGFVPSGTTARIGPTNNAGANILAVDNDSGVTGTVILVWDGAQEVTADASDDANIDTNGLGGIDFLPTLDSNGVFLDVQSIDLNVMATLDIWDMDGDKASVSHTFAVASSYTFLFSDFISANALLDLTQVGALRLTLQGPQDWDGQFRLVGVRGVPEPAILPLMGFALVLAGMARRQAGRI